MLSLLAVSPDLSMVGCSPLTTVHSPHLTCTASETPTPQPPVHHCLDCFVPVTSVTSFPMPGRPLAVFQ